MTALAFATKPTDPDADDSDLVAAVRAGDDRAFEILFGRYRRRIAAYVRGMVRDHGGAEDITQEVFISALRRMRETDREIAFRPWIYEIAKNACIDAFRRSRNTHEVSFDTRDAERAVDQSRLAAPAVTPDAVMEGKVRFADLRGALGGLSETHHDILVMREFEGLSYRVIGERLGMSGPAVESTLFRARRRLSEEYEELASGERCRRVQQIVDARPQAAGLREQRRLARHLSHCQPCRRYAGLAGYDLDVAVRPATVAARIAGFLPLPDFLRRRGVPDEAGSLLAQPSAAPLAHWSASIASVLDPATASGWSKAIATAATVAVAGGGAGSAITHRNPLKPFSLQAPAITGLPAVPSLAASSLPSFVSGWDAALGGDAPGAPASAVPAGTASAVPAGTASTVPAGTASAFPAATASGGDMGWEMFNGLSEALPAMAAPLAGEASIAAAAASMLTGKGVIDAVRAQERAATALDDLPAAATNSGGLIGGIRNRDPARDRKRERPGDGDGTAIGGRSGGAAGHRPGPIRRVIGQLSPGSAPAPSPAGGPAAGGSKVVQGLVQFVGGASAGSSGDAGGRTSAARGLASQTGSTAPAKPATAPSFGAGQAPGVVDTVWSTVNGVLSPTSPPSSTP